MTRAASTLLALCLSASAVAAVFGCSAVLLVGVTVFAPRPESEVR